MNIKVGEYIRTEEGHIGKIEKIIENTLEDDTKQKEIIIDNIFFNDCGEASGFVYYKDIKKHSFNIIDLIEVGDYVNEYKALEIADSIYKNSKRILIYRNEKEKYERWIYIQEYNGKVHTQDDIKTIVTKEQFKAMEYEV